MWRVQFTMDFLGYNVGELRKEEVKGWGRKREEERKRRVTEREKGT